MGEPVEQRAGPMTRATLLFLGASVSQLPAIRYALDAGYRVAAADGEATAPGLALAHASTAIDFSDVERVAEWAESIRVDGILAISTDRGVVPAAAIAAKLGLPGIGTDVARAMTDKARMRATLAAGGICQPRHRVARTGAELERALGELRLPVVMKPADSGGQRGVFLIEDPGDAARHLEESLSFSCGRAAIVEEYVEGTELNVLAAVRDGEATVLTISDRLRPRGAGFGVGWIHSFPSSLDRGTLDDVHAVVASSVQALGLRDGIAFPQVIASPEGISVVEVAARIAAGQMADLVRYSTGIELYRIAVAQALGERVPDDDVRPRFIRPVAIRFLTASPGVLPVGEVTSISGMNAVRAAPGVLAADMYIGTGARIRPVQVDADRNGYVVATGDTPEDALARADDASRLLVVSTTSEPRRAARRRTYRRRALVAGFAVVLAAASAVAIGFSQGTALSRPLVTATRVDAVLAPLCRCDRSVAHVSFRLARRTRISLEMLSAPGRVAAHVARNRLAGPGMVRLAWRGRTLLGRALPDGSYTPVLVLPALRETVRLPAVEIVGPPR